MPELMKLEPRKREYLERIGDQEYLLPEARLNVSQDVHLWDRNPRLIPYAGNYPDSEDELEARLKRSSGYDGLKKSIADLGQLEPVYVWRRGDDQAKYLVIEGATRVTVLRELFRKHEGQPSQAQFEYVTAKVLPEEFDEKQVAILLARIHVRGTGVRNWDRYVQAKFIYDKVEGDPPLLTLTAMAAHMGKSTSWASRLRDAYGFAKQFVDWVDSQDAERLAVNYFSTLEEISKATGFGPRVKADDEEGERLREEVFAMVKHDVFKEYRDARYMAQYFDDPEKWHHLQGHEKHAAHDLANQIRAGHTGVKGKVGSLYGQLERALDKGDAALDEEDIDELQRCVDLVAARAAAGIGTFRLRLNQFSKALFDAPLEDVKAITREEYDRLEEGLSDLRFRLERHATWIRRDD